MFNRLDYEVWSKRDGQDLVLKAAEVVKDRLARYQKPPISRDIEEEVEAFANPSFRGDSAS